MSPPTEPAATHEDSPASGDVRTARLLVAGQFVLIGILVVLPNGDDWPVPTGLTVACSAATVLGLTVMVIGATGLTGICQGRRVQGLGRGEPSAALRTMQVSRLSSQAAPSRRRNDPITRCRAHLDYRYAGTDDEARAPAPLDAKHLTLMRVKAARAIVVAGA